MSVQLTRSEMAEASGRGGVRGLADPELSCSMGVRAADLFVIPPITGPFDESGQERGISESSCAEEP